MLKTVLLNSSRRGVRIVFLMKLISICARRRLFFNFLLQYYGVSLICANFIYNFIYK